MFRVDQDKVFAHRLRLFEGLWCTANAVRKKSGPDLHVGPCSMLISQCVHFLQHPTTNPPPPCPQPNMACMYPVLRLASYLQVALVSLVPLQYKAQRPLSGAVRTTNPSDSPPAHRAASNLGARPATAPDGPLPSHRQPGGSLLLCCFLAFDAPKRFSATPWSSDLVAGLRPWGQAASLCLSGGALQPLFLSSCGSLLCRSFPFPPSASSGGSL